MFHVQIQNVLNPLSKLEESAEEEGEADIEEELNLSRDEHAGCTENKITWLVLLPEVGVLMSSFLQA